MDKQVTEALLNLKKLGDAGVLNPSEQRLYRRSLIGEGTQYQKDVTPRQHQIFEVLESLLAVWQLHDAGILSESEYKARRRHVLYFEGPRLLQRMSCSSKDRTNSIGMKFVDISPGQCEVGGVFLGPDDHDRSGVVVKFTHGIEVQKSVVSQSQYLELMGNNPSWFRKGDFPVECVSWFDAVEFANALSIKEGFQPAYLIKPPLLPDGPQTSYVTSSANYQPRVEWDRSADGYRLPTSAEWECAARAEGRKSWVSIFYDEYKSKNSTRYAHRNDLSDYRASAFVRGMFHFTDRNWLWYLLIGPLLKGLSFLLCFGNKDRVENLRRIVYSGFLLALSPSTPSPYSTRPIPNDWGNCLPVRGCPGLNRWGLRSIDLNVGQWCWDIVDCGLDGCDVSRGDPQVNIGTNFLSAQNWDTGDSPQLSGVFYVDEGGTLGDWRLAKVDPTSPSANEWSVQRRVMRGTSWNSRLNEDIHGVRHIWDAQPLSRQNTIGFRLVRTRFDQTPTQTTLGPIKGS